MDLQAWWDDKTMTEHDTTMTEHDTTMTEHDTTGAAPCPGGVFRTDGAKSAYSAKMFSNDERVRHYSRPSQGVSSFVDTVL